MYQIFRFFNVFIISKLIHIQKSQNKQISRIFVKIVSGNQINFKKLWNLRIKLLQNLIFPKIITFFDVSAGQDTIIMLSQKNFVVIEAHLTVAYLQYEKLESQKKLPTLVSTPVLAHPTAAYCCCRVLSHRNWIWVNFWSDNTRQLHC